MHKVAVGSFHQTIQLNQTAIDREVVMPQSQQSTTENCFTPEQRDFFRACSEMAKFTAKHPRGFEPFSAEASKAILLQHNVSENEIRSGLKIENMRRFWGWFKSSEQCPSFM